MRELLGKIGRFCENHVEKIVLVIVGAFCIWLFFTKVIFSPNGVPYDGKTYSPGQIDAAIQKKAEELALQLQSGTGTNAKKVTYVPRLTGPIDPNDPVVSKVFVGRPAPESFLDLLRSPLGFMSSELAASETVAPSPDDRPKYALPRIGPVTDVAVGHIRAAAYVPLEEVTAQRNYDSVETEPNDIDLVTVEAKFNVAELYRQFNAYFAGTEVAKQAWRDPCMANPKFAAVNLQRQTLLDDGTWSDWVDVPRSRIEANRNLFQIVENVKDLPPGGLGVRMMQYADKFVTMALLQPEAYQIASAEEEWFPPTYYTKFKEVQRKIEADEKRKEREEQRDRQEADTGGGRRETIRGGGTTATGAGGRRRDTTAMGGGAGDPYGGYGGAGGTRDRSTRGARTRGGAPGMGMDPMAPDARQRGARTGRRGPGDAAYDPALGAYGGYPMDGSMRLQPTTDEVYYEFAQAGMNYTTDLAKMKDPLLFWAFDDTMEPGRTHRYRIRLGVFNPVAGTDKLAPRDADKKNQVILWSEFSKVTDSVSIPKRLYFFAKDVQDRQTTATVEVARYMLGYWRTEDFQVRPGDVIGKEMEPKEEKPKRTDRLMAPGGRITGAPMGREMLGMGPYAAGPYGGPAGMAMYQTPTDPADAAINPELIDYSTNTVLVDLLEVSDWSTQPSLQPRVYYDMLYTHDGTNIEHMPVGTRNWSKDLLATYQFISTEKRKEPQSFKSFQKGGFRSRGGVGGPGGAYGSPYDMMGGGGPYGPTPRR